MTFRSLCCYVNDKISICKFYEVKFVGRGQTFGVALAISHVWILGSSPDSRCHPVSCHCTPWAVAVDNLASWFLAPLLASVWPRTDCCRCLRRKSVNGKSLSLSPSLISLLSNKWKSVNCKKLNKTGRKNSTLFTACEVLDSVSVCVLQSFRFPHQAGLRAGREIRRWWDQLSGEWSAMQWELLKVSHYDCGWRQPEASALYKRGRRIPNAFSIHQACWQRQTLICLYHLCLASC